MFKKSFVPAPEGDDIKLTWLVFKFFDFATWRTEQLE